MIKAHKSKSTNIVCAFCKKEGLERIPAELLRTSNSFCGKSCAAKFNNPIRKRKRKPLKDLCQCGQSKYIQSLRCNNCRLTERKEASREKFLSKTFGEIKETYNNESYYYYNKIRTSARNYVKFHLNLEKRCKICGYDYYVELCHIKPISAFPNEATMAEINSVDNLVYLCPNHHKEQESGKLSLYDIQ